MFKILYSAGRNDSGAVAVMMGVMLTVLVAFVGLGVEVGMWWLEKSKAQAAADAAAYAGGYELLRIDPSGNISQKEELIIENIAKQVAAANGYSNGVTITVDKNSSVVTAEVNRSLQPLLLGIMLRQDTINIGALAKVAIVEDDGGTCILALDESASPGIKLTGNMKVKLNECGLHANSKGFPSLKIHGNATLQTSDDVSASGYTSVQGSINVEDMNGNSKSVIENAATKPDPYADVNVVKPGLCDEQQQVKVSDSKDLTPGVYYCGGVKFAGKGSVTLQPGTYYIGSGLEFTSKFDVTGNGVSFVLMEGANVTMHGNANISLSAPTNGDLEGILFYQDPDTANKNGTPGDSIFNGNMISNLVGTIYFPKSHVTLNGNFNGTMLCSDFVAGTIMINGNMSLSIDNAACKDMGKDFGGTRKFVALIQ